MNSRNTLPKVAVLLATFNGSRWLLFQIHSILSQVNVSVTLFVSDDFSEDSTLIFLNELAKKDQRVKILPANFRAGSAGRNFYRLILDVDLTGYNYISLADQDDIWDQDKLSRHISLMQAHHVDGVSSNVIAFWPDGNKKLIYKSHKQRKYDFLFESAGPGCTYLLTPYLANKVKVLLADPFTKAYQVTLHDWLIYAICRSSGRKWFIDTYPSVQYRQHEKNVVGANSGLKAKLVRFNKISNGWYRNEVLKILNISSSLSNDPQLNYITNSIIKSDFGSRITLLKYVPHARRSFIDRLFLALMIIFCIF